MSVLVSACLDIAKLGYNKNSNILDSDYQNQRLLSLGNYILNGSNLGRKYYLRFKKKNDVGCKRNHIALCFGAGIDSYTAFFLAALAGDQVTLIHTDYGQPYFAQERSVYEKLFTAIFDNREDTPFNDDIDKIAYTLGSLSRVRYKVEFKREKIDFLDREKLGDTAWKDYIFPARNLVLAAIGAKYADTVWIVANKRSNETIGTPDKTSRFYREASYLFSDYYQRDITVESPFFHLSKLEATKQYLEKGGSHKALFGTFSCYSPLIEPVENNHCGHCYACFKRYKLFQALNIEYNFAATPWEGPNYHEYMMQESKKGRE